MLGMIPLLVIDYVYELRKVSPSCCSEADRTFALPNIDHEKTF